MIKFFRRIRQQLLSEGKTGRYFKYALGEIVLVVIGILIALQLNNWNQNIALKNEELKVIKSLNREFSENLEKFDTIYQIHLNRKKNIEIIMSHEVKNLSLDSISSLFFNLGSNYTFDPYQGFYNSIINSGKIELISNDSLKLQLSKFEDILSDYQEEETGVMEFVQDNLYPFLIDNLKLNFNASYILDERTEEEKTKYKDELIKLIDSDKYENLLVYVYAYMGDTFKEGPILREEIVSTINLLESEIEKDNL